MAQTINTNTGYGLFKVGFTEFTAITESTFSADVSDCKDPIAVLMDIPAGAGDKLVLTCLSANCDEGVDVELTAGKVNVVYITSYGLKKQDGSADFALTASDGSSVASLGIKVGFLKHASVIHH